MAWWKLIKIYVKNGSKNDVYRLTKWDVKNDWKYVPKWPPKICSKMWSKIEFSRGGPGGLKWSKSTGGSGGVLFINFLKFCSFLQKLPHFSTPKSTPKKGPIKMSFPTNRLYFFQNGGPKMSLFGGSGGGPLGPKNVDTTI
jgi:hypothetical protein